MNHDIYWLFNRYWWLFFPLGWAIGQLVKLWLRHLRARQTLDILKSYVDQGKEPPSQLMDMLRPPERAQKVDRWSLPRRNWIPFGLFAGLAAAFVFALSGLTGEDSNGGLFVGLVIAGLAAGFLGNTLSAQSPKNDQDDQRTPPP